MKKFTKLSKAMMLASLATVAGATAAFGLAACDNGTEPETKAPVITKYSATLSAGITMGTEPVSFADILSDTYITDNNGSYTLTLTFKAGEIEVMGQKGSIFVDDNPQDDANVGDIVNGSIGAYNKDGVLVTEGVSVTYSSGNDYLMNSKHENVYYVVSAAMPIDAVRAEYSLTFYVNSALMGKQFSNDSYRATLAVDLESGQTVNAIGGLGVSTRGTVSVQEQPEEPDGGEDPAPAPGGDAVLPADGETVKYNASIEAGFMNNQYSFGGTLTAAYLTNNDGEYTLTLTFSTAKLEVMNMTANIFVYKSAASSFGYYDGEDLKTDVALTYGNGYVSHSSDGYVSCVTSMAFPVSEVLETYDIDIYFGSDFAQGNKQYNKAPVTLELASGAVVEKMSGVGSAAPAAAPKAVTSMTFTVDEVAESYNLSVYVTAFNATSVSGMQFPYTGSNNTVTDAVLTIDKDSATEDGGVTTYDATLNAVVAMGQNNVNFTENLVKNVTVKEVSDGYEVTINFEFGTVNMPFNNVMTGYMNGASNKDYFGNVVEPVFGYYEDDTLVTAVSLTYSTSND